MAAINRLITCVNGFDSRLCNHFLTTMADVFDLVIPPPALFGRTGWRSQPPCNFGGGAKAPPKPAPTPAPTQIEKTPEVEAGRAANRRQGLASTILQPEMGATFGSPTTLGAGKPKRMTAYGGEL